MNNYGRDKPPLEEGEVINAECISVGEKGDGIFKSATGFVVIVPGTEVGKYYNIKITTIRSRVAFGEVVEE